MEECTWCKLQQAAQLKYELKMLSKDQAYVAYLCELPLGKRFIKLLADLILQELDKHDCKT